MKRIENIVCTGCSLTCNDLVIDIENENKIVNVWGSCSHGTKRIKEMITNRLKGSETNIEKAIERAVEILSSAKKPLIYGFANSSNEAIKLGLEIARKINGIFDTPPSICHYHIPMIEEIETKKLTFEDVLDKSDFIMYFFVDLSNTHLRHASKYTIYPRGEIIKTGRESRTVLMVDYWENDSMKIAHHKITLTPGEELKFIKKLRRTIADKKVVSGKDVWLTIESWLLLLDDIKKSSFISIFIGNHILTNIMAAEIYREIVKLMEDIMSIGLMSTLIPLAENVNSMGAAIIPYKMFKATHAIDFNNGNPVYEPSITNAAMKLLNNEVDAALIVESDLYTHLPLSIARKLKEIPTIYIGEKRTLTSKIAKIKIPRSILGIEDGGKVYRTDGVEVELTPFMNPPPSIESEKTILKEILQGIR